MTEKFSLLISGLDPFTVAFLVLGILGALVLLPKVVNEIGLKKIGPIQLEQENQTLNHLTNKRIEELDIENRENLWTMTEDFLADIAMKSQIACSAMVDSILQVISSPIRTMVLLNHIAPKLTMENHGELVKKLKRNLSKSIRDIKNTSLPNSCPAINSISEINPERYSDMIESWILLARDVTVKSCFQKIQIYEEALSNTKDKHWKKVFETCISKNISYIEGMGWFINKQNKLERA